jgi:hypothetical protein
MGADNHLTVEPQENSNDIEYDDSAHDRYMCSLRLALIRSGTISGEVDA